MQLEPETKELNVVYNIQTKIESASSTTENQILQKKVDSQLYMNFEHNLEKSKFHYNKQSIYFGKKVSKQKVVEESIKYLNFLEQNIKPLPLQHYEQLIFLLDIFTHNNKLITTSYDNSFYSKNSSGPANFMLAFYEIKPKFDVKKFVSFKNWNHLQTISFFSCDWFDNDDWRAFVENAGNFNNLKNLYLQRNRVSQIKEGDIQQFQLLQGLDFMKNPLSKQSIGILTRFQKKKKQMGIVFRLFW